MNSTGINMLRMMSHGLAIGSCLMLSACYHMSSSSAPESQFDVRSATVTSSGIVSHSLAAAVSERVNAAIAATPHTDTLPAASLTVRITLSEKLQGYQKDRNTAKVDIDASSIATGSVIAVKSFESTTFSSDSTTVDELMAEDIAARIRAAYRLTTPRYVN